MDAAIYKNSGKMHHVFEVAKIKKQHQIRFLKIKRNFICGCCHHHVYFRLHSRNGHIDCFFHEKGQYECTNKVGAHIEQHDIDEREEKKIRKIIKSYDRINIISNEINIAINELKQKATKYLIANNTKPAYVLEPSKSVTYNVSLNRVLDWLIQYKDVISSGTTFLLNERLFSFDELFLDLSDENLNVINEERVYWGKIDSYCSGKYPDYFFLNSSEINNKFSIYLYKEAKEAFLNQFEMAKEKISLPSNPIINRDFYIYVAVLGVLEINENGKKHINVGTTEEITWFAIKVFKSN